MAPGGRARGGAPRFGGVNFGGRRTGRSRWDVKNPRGEEENWEAGARGEARSFWGEKLPEWGCWGGMLRPHPRGSPNDGPSTPTHPEV